MTCHVAWSDRHGEHTCRHNEGHETRRHGCVCGSYSNDRGSVVHSTPRDTTSAGPPVAGDTATGGDGSPSDRRPRYVANN